MDQTKEHRQLTDFLHLYKQNYFSLHGSQNQLPQEEIKKRWSRDAAELISILQADLVAPNEFNEVQNYSAPMSRRRGLTEATPSYAARVHASTSMDRKRSSPPSLSTTLVSTHPQQLSLQQCGDVAVCKMQKSNTGRSFPTAVAFEPSEYVKQEGLYGRVNQDSVPSFEPLRTLSWTPKQDSQLHQADLAPPAPASGLPLGNGALDGTNNTQEAISQPMTREPTMGTSFCSGFDMMRIHSQTREMNDHSLLSNSRDSRRDFDSVELGNGNGLASSEIRPMDQSRDHHSQPQQLASITSAATHTPVATPPVDAKAIVMKRQPSNKGSSLPPVVEEEKSMLRNAQKLLNAQKTQIPKPSTPDALLVKSIDGKEKCQITPSPVSRPAREKIKCKLCDRRPEGFKGHNELARHNKLFHQKTRTVWICIDGSPEKNMLSECENCKKRKTYNQVHGAAAHLRRIHFNPRSKEPKVKGVAERAGMGGGNWPPIKTLKARWMEELEQPVPNNYYNDDDDETDENEGDEAEPETDQLDESIEIGEVEPPYDVESPHESPLVTPSLDAAPGLCRTTSLAGPPLADGDLFEWPKDMGSDFQALMTPDSWDTGSFDFMADGPLFDSLYDFPAEEGRDMHQRVPTITTSA